MKPAPQTFHVKSFGCQMNVYDGERMGELMAAQGLSPADADAADLVVLNTCHIREKATEKVYSDIGRIRKQAGKQGRAPMIAIAGCVAQAEGEEIVARAKVDVVVGPQSYHQLPALVARAAAGGPALDTDMPLLAKFGALPARRRAGPSSFLTVQEGCDKFCTYCVVPYTRGAEISRPFAAILDEAKALVDAGAREITLLGQNVNAWADGERGLHDLIRALDRVPGLARIRYTTSHPNDMSQGLIDAHRDVESLMPFLHLPVQAGSDRVLKAMNRHHTRDSYLRLLDRVRAARPDIALSGDFIVGFPGETDAEFEETLSLVDAVGYAQAFSFKYSPRPGTPAATLSEQVPAQVMDERLQRLQAALGRHQLAFNAASVGRTCAVLIERPGKRPGQMLGKSPWLQSVHLATDAAVGTLIEVELASAGPVSLGGVAHCAIGGVSLTPLVLVPGLGSDEAVWRGPIERLTDVAACVVAETRLDDSVAAIARRVLASAPPRFALAGISMGGYVALEIMRQAPERVTRLALFDTSARADTPEQSAGRRAALAALDKAPMAVLARHSLAQLFADDATAAVKDAVVAMSVRVGREAYARQQHANIARIDSRPTLGAIAVPTLVVVGERDILTPPALAEELRDGIPGATLAIVAGSGHLPPIEKPEESAALLRAWLRD